MWTGKVALMDTDQTVLMGSAVYMSLCEQSYCQYIVFVVLCIYMHRYIYIYIGIIAIWNLENNNVMKEKG